MSISKELERIIAESIKEEGAVCEMCGEVHEGSCGDGLDDAITTSNVAGYSTPHAFSGNKKSDEDKEKENATNSTGYTMVKEIYNQKYPAFKNDSTKNSRQKVNGAIQEINKKLFEIERIIGRAVKLKKEDGVSSDRYLKSTRPRMTKIAERLIKVSHKLREIAS